MKLLAWLDILNGNPLQVTKRAGWFLLFWTALSVSLGAQTQEAPPQFELIPLDTDNPEMELSPVALNDHNQVVGTGFPGGAQRQLFLWDGGSMVWIGPAHSHGHFADINNWEHVVGGGPALGHWIWRADGLEKLSVASSLPVFINDHQMVAGNVLEDGSQVGYVRDLFANSEDVQEIGTLGGDWTEITAINNLGTVAGISQTRHEEARAFVFHESTGIRELEIPLSGGDRSKAVALNNLDDVLVLNHNESYLVENATETTTPITPPSPGGTIRAVALNDQGQVVGIYTLPGEPLLRPFFWQDGTAYDFNQVVGHLPPSVKLVAAVDINQNGVILARGHSKGQSTAFLLIPITVWTEKEF